MDRFYLFSVIFLLAIIGVSMYRVIKGPTRGDRILGINIIGTKTIVIIAIISFLLKEVYFIDVVLVYALISFIGSFAVAREIGSGEEDVSGKGEDHA